MKYRVVKLERCRPSDHDILRNPQFFWNLSWYTHGFRVHEFLYLSDSCATFDFAGTCIYLLEDRDGGSSMCGLFSLLLQFGMILNGECNIHTFYIFHIFVKPLKTTHSNVVACWITMSISYQFWNVKYLIPAFTGGFCHGLGWRVYYGVQSC